ncbi:hypothetical protein M378DRAFT_154981 [Amanita muscaria Koide BX008]|uniref:Uncharacterized protein n=1 Tax=Amanita muscaria (strain Koide BX008) TaxID=946122 RepID=A0A0C2T606_AMAMK|nr:hypothetical protein M378DRAFT_154981 [Amanita muscaria Koide BX008]
MGREPSESLGYWERQPSFSAIILLLAQLGQRSCKIAQACACEQNLTSSKVFDSWRSAK